MQDNQPTQDEIVAIADALARGQKIQAIKIYCDATGKGLKDAKDFIEELHPRLAEQDPERFGKAPAASGTGCGLVLFVFLVLSASGGAAAAIL